MALLCASRFSNPSFARGPVPYCMRGASGPSLSDAKPGGTSATPLERKELLGR